MEYSSHATMAYLASGQRCDASYHHCQAKFAAILRRHPRETGGDRWRDQQESKQSQIQSIQLRVHLRFDKVSFIIGSRIMRKLTE